MPAAVVYAVLVITIVIAGLVVARPAITAGREGKMLAFLGLFIFPVLTAGLGFDHHLERSKETSFCLSCHVMAPRCWMLMGSPMIAFSRGSRMG